MLRQATSEDEEHPKTRMRRFCRNSFLRWMPDYNRNKRLNCIKITRIVQKINKSSAYTRTFRGHNEDGPDTVVRMLGSDRLGERKTMMREETTIAFMRGSITRLNKKRLIGSIYSESKGSVKVELIVEPVAVLMIS